MLEIDKGALYLTFNNIPDKNQIVCAPLGGIATTPEEEVRMGKQLRSELQDYRAGVVKARLSVLEAMARGPINSAED